jgi:UDP-GlcNAc:undecaprenyl-phosphate GlcNAc-1-phosphate transferase
VAVYAVILASSISGLFLVPLGLWLLRQFSLERKNYRGALIPLPGGVVFPLGITFALIVGKVTGIYKVSDLVSLLALTWGFSILGFIDDVVGSHEHKGFRGHIKALSQGTITTGALKALIGGCLSLFVGIYSTGILLHGFVVGIIIALSANMINLLDLAPGRALKGFFLTLLLVVLLSSSVSLSIILPLLVVAIVYFPADIREEAMMGDTGSNVLGSLLGFWIAIRSSIFVGISFAILLFVMNVLGERISFSKIIEKSRLLGLLDGLGRRRLERT